MAAPYQFGIEEELFLANARTRGTPKRVELFQHYGGAPSGAGTVPRWILYVTDSAKGAAMANRFTTLLEPAPRETDHLGGLLIVRPDAYIGLSAGQEQWDDAERYLETLAAGRP